MTLLLISFVTLIFMIIYDEIIPQYIWAGACGLLIGVGVSIWLFYYRREKGTMLWIPRNIAKYLTERIKATTLTAEAFSLGLSSVTAEALFIVAPITIGALTIIGLPATWQLIGLAIYTCLSISSLIIVSVAITSGNNISRIQKWRESNKYFLQFASGAGLIILSIFIYVSQILSTAIGQL